MTPENRIRSRMPRLACFFVSAAVSWMGVALAACDDTTHTAETQHPSKQPPLPPALPQQPPEQLVSTKRLMATIAELPVKRAALGDAAHVDGLHETQQQLIAAFHEMGLEPTLQRLDYAGGLHTPDRPLCNIIIDIPGEPDDTEGLADEVVLFSAHFDAVPGAPGADDDGTGVAAILEMARLLKDRPMKRTLRLVLFNLEEVGIVGSLQYVHALKQAMAGGGHTDLWRGETIVGMVSMDMLGYYRDEPNSQRLPVNIPEWVWAATGTQPPTVGDFIATATVLKYRPFSQALKAAMHEAEPSCKVFALDALPIAPPDLLRSDHAPFWSLSVPAVIMSDTAELRSPHYHTPSDTIETIDRERYTLTVRAIVGAAWRLCGPAERDDAPDWLAPPQQTPTAHQ